MLAIIYHRLIWQLCCPTIKLPFSPWTGLVLCWFLDFVLFKFTFMNIYLCFHRVTHKLMNLLNFELKDIRSWFVTNYFETVIVFFGWYTFRFYFLLQEWGEADDLVAGLAPEEKMKLSFTKVRSYWFLVIIALRFSLKRQMHHYPEVVFRLNLSTLKAKFYFVTFYF